MFASQFSRSELHLADRSVFPASLLGCRPLPNTLEFADSNPGNPRTATPTDLPVNV
jgi:hypothetical protein